MHRSTDRILTTHVGSLPRPADLYAMIEQKQEGGAIDEAAFGARVKSAVAEIVKRQADAGHQQHDRRHQPGVVGDRDRGPG